MRTHWSSLCWMYLWGKCHNPCIKYYRWGKLKNPHRLCKLRQSLTGPTEKGTSLLVYWNLQWVIWGVVSLTGNAIFKTLYQQLVTSTWVKNSQERPKKKSINLKFIVHVHCVQMVLNFTCNLNIIDAFPWSSLYKFYPLLYPHFLKKVRVYCFYLGLSVRPSVRPSEEKFVTGTLSTF